MTDRPHNPCDPPEKRTEPAKPGTARTSGGAGVSVREVVAGHLAGGMTIKDAAAAGNVSERSVRRWSSEEPDFRATVERLRAEAIGRAMGRLSGTMTSAADVLRGLLQSEDEDVRLKASKAVLELGLKLRDHVALEERVRELERRLAGDDT